MTDSICIWILDQDLGTHFIYREVLKKFKLKFFSTTKMLDMALAHSKQLPNLILSEIELADQLFINYLRESNKIKNIPFVIVSHSKEADVMRSCYHHGALDFICKPLWPSVLLIKIEKALGLLASPPTKIKTTRYHDKTSSQLASSGSNPGYDLKLQSSSLSVVIGNQFSVSLTAKEYQIMAIFHSALGIPVSRQQLIHQIWGLTKVNSRTLDVHLAKLRGKLRTSGFDIRLIGKSEYALCCFDGSK